MTWLRLASLASLAALALAGCGASQPVTMADSFDLDLFGPHQDDLHSPYVAGSQFNITVSSTSNQDETGWTLTSSDRQVLQVSAGLLEGIAGVVCAGAGTATLRVLDAKGNVLDSHAVTVAIPDRVGIYAEGPLLTGASDQTALVTQASVVTGGEATFLVRYFAQGTELYGSGALSVTGTGGVTATTTSASFAAARDFLQVSPAPMGASGTVSLVIDDTVLGELPITAVEPSSVTLVTILSQATDSAQKGDSLALYAHAIDATSSDVYGASFDWRIDGQVQPSAYYDAPVDLFFYSYDSSISENVAATYETFAPYAVVHGQGGSVASTGFIGCALGGALGTSGTSSSFLVLGLAIAGAFAARRKRSR